ncbi:MAG TPA: AzlD domain-containing protein [Anaerolineaceae bacterium]|nr:AzlD domain-containing protein [Anaerolineaceae bacterium]
MAETTLLITIIGMALVTYLPRLLPAWLLRGRALPPFIAAWLRYVPAAVLAALLLPSLLVEGGELNLAWNNLYLWAALPAAFVALKWKSLFGTVLTGMGLVALARLLGA